MRVAVRTIELDDPLTTIGGLDGYQSVKGLVRLHRTPIGYIDLPEQLREIHGRDADLYPDLAQRPAPHRVR